MTKQDVTTCKITMDPLLEVMLGDLDAMRNAIMGHILGVHRMKVFTHRIVHQEKNHGASTRKMYHLRLACRKTIDYHSYLETS